METTLTCALCSSLGSNDGNFLPNTGDAKKTHARVHYTQLKIFDGGITEDSILQKCFPIDYLKVERPTLSRIECHQSLLDLCKSLKVKRQSNITSTVCNLCGLGISIKANMNINLIRHATAHLEVKLFKCRHCDLLSSNGVFIRSHIRKTHNIDTPNSEDFEDKTAAYFDQISDGIKRCFSTAYPSASGFQRQFVIGNSRSLRTSQRSIIHTCRSIYVHRTKPESIECNLCGTSISVRGRSFRAIRMSTHAAAHLEVKLFTCRHCSQPISRKSAMIKHLKNFHQVINGNGDDFDDQSEKLHSEHLNMIERCFTADPIKTEEAPATKDRTNIRAKAKVQRHTTMSKLAIERGLFYNRVIRQIVDSDGKVKCSLCSKRLWVKHSDKGIKRTALYHAEMHLQKPIYLCKVCKNPFSTQVAIVGHLRTKHLLGLGKNHECIADEFHEEIMAILAKCYVTEGLS